MVVCLSATHIFQKVREGTRSGQLLRPGSNLTAVPGSRTAPLAAAEGDVGLNQGNTGDGSKDMAPPVPCSTSQPAGQLGADRSGELDEAEARLRRFMSKLLDLDSADNFFKSAVQTSQPGCENYYEVVRQPMYFDKMLEKVGTLLLER